MPKPTLHLAAMTCLWLVGCATVQREELQAARERKARIAVVALSISDYIGQLETSGGAAVPRWMDGKMSSILSVVEHKLGSTGMQLIPASAFVGTEAFKKLAGGKPRDTTYSPAIAGQPLTIAASHGGSADVSLSTEEAKQLCSAVGADLIAVVHSQWTLRPVSVAPKHDPYGTAVNEPFVAPPNESAFAAETATTLRLYGADGRELFADGRHFRSPNALSKISDAGDLEAWLDGVDQALAQLIKEMY